VEFRQAKIWTKRSYAANTKKLQAMTIIAHALTRAAHHAHGSIHKKDAQLDEEIHSRSETREDFSSLHAQAAKQSLCKKSANGSAHLS